MVCAEVIFVYFVCINVAVNEVRVNSNILTVITTVIRGRFLV